MLTQNPQELQELIKDHAKESVRVKSVFVEENHQLIVQAGIMLATAINSGRKILICGNGGSSSDSLHFSGEALGKLCDDRPPFPCVALTADVATLTAVGNDYGFEHIFARQVRALGNAGDVLIAISTSGNSPNILKATEQARTNGMRVIALTGGQGGQLGKMADIHLNVCQTTLTMRIQETHIFILHSLALITERLWVRT